jgi:hypothetical protein
MRATRRDQIRKLRPAKWVQGRSRAAAIHSRFHGKARVGTADLVPAVGAAVAYGLNPGISGAIVAELLVSVAPWVALAMAVDGMMPTPTVLHVGAGL